METRAFGRTGMQVSPLCLGCMSFGGQTEDDEAFRMVDRALDAGINFFDTANVYNRGKGEDVLGAALARDGKREKVVLATKVLGLMDENDPNAHGSHRRHVVEQCHASLKRLKTDWIDLYQIHRPSRWVPIDETLRALDDLVRAGKVRYLGTSTFAAWQLVESLWASKELGLNRFVSEQPPYNLLDRRAERELVPAAQTYGFALIPWSPLAGGFLTGKYEQGKRRPEGSRYADEGSDYANKHFTERAFAVLDVVERMARKKKRTPSQVALAWVMHQPGITSAIMGPRTLEQLEDNLGALDVPGTPEDRAPLDAVAPPGRCTVPYYDADFGPHAFRW